MPVSDIFCKSLLHFEGTGGSTVFTDETGKVWSVAGGSPGISNSKSKFGVGSLSLNGSSWISTPIHDDFKLGTGDWTIEMWVNTTYNSYSASQYAQMWGFQGSGPGYGMYLNAGKYLYFYCGSFQLLDTLALNDGQWHHVAAVRSGSNVYVFVDGVVRLSKTGVNYAFDDTRAFSIGHDGQNVAFVGNYDEFRLSKGIARWSSNFTPPSSAHYSSVSCKILFQEDGVIKKLIPPSASGSKTENAIPVMTTRTASSGAVTSSTEYGDPYYYNYKAFDGTTLSTNTNGGWLTQSGITTGWLAYEFPSQIIINKYTILSRPGGSPNEWPKDWTFEGWNGSSWVVLDIRSGVTDWTVNMLKSFTFSNNASYKKYRINITANCGYSTYMGFRQLTMHEAILGTGGSVEVIGSGVPTYEMFVAHGVTDTALLTRDSLDLLADDVKVLVWTEGTDSRKISTKRSNQDLCYAVSFDGKNTWYTRVRGSWDPLSLSELYSRGMSKKELEAIPQSEWATIFQKGDIYFAVAFRTFTETVTPDLDKIEVTLPYTNGRTDVKYAFSDNMKGNWKVYKDGAWKVVNVDLLKDLGMTKEEVESLNSTTFAPLVGHTPFKLDVAICLVSNDKAVSPSVDQVTFNYDQYETPLISRSISIPVPERGYRNVLENGSYVLKLAEGIAFDDATKDYQFYTTADKIKIRPLDTGVNIGGRMSLIYKVEIINAFETKDFMIKLQVAQNGVFAKAMDNCAFLDDAILDEEKTKIEISSTEDPFVSVYPMFFNLRHGERKVVYIRFTPTVTTDNDAYFQLSAIAQPL